MPYLFFAFICLAWGGSFILMDRAADAFGPVTIAIGRMLGGAIVLGLYCLASGRWIRITRTDVLHLAVIALFANSWPYAVQPYVMRQAGEHAFFGLLVAFVPLATIAASIPMLGKWPTRRQLVGVIGGLACLGLVAWDGVERGMPLHLLALAASSPLAYAFANTYLKWKVDHLPPAPLTTMFLALGVVWLLPLAAAPRLLEDLQLGPPAEPRGMPTALASLLILGVIGTGVAILMFVQLIKRQGPLFAGMVTYVVPMVALFWGQFDGELLTARQIAAIAGVLLMVALVQWPAAAELRPLSEPPA